MSPDISIFFVFGGGLISFFSPCILPLLPSYLSMLAGGYNKYLNRRQIIIPALVFMAAFSLVFIILGLSASFLGQYLLKNLAILKKISGIVVIILGLNMIGLLKFKFLAREKRFKLATAKNKYLTAVIMGVALALAWTPCVGPVLASVLMYAATSDTVYQGGILLAFYSLGFAIPFLLTAVFLDRILKHFKKINKYLSLIHKIAGLILIILGILIYTNYLEVITQSLYN